LPEAGDARPLMRQQLVVRVVARHAEVPDVSVRPTRSDGFLGTADVMILKYFRATKFGVFGSECCSLFRIEIITLVFKKNAILLRRKMAKIAENCDHNLRPLEENSREKSAQFYPKM
jgi:hypothetical protein